MPSVHDENAAPQTNAIHTSVVDAKAVLCPKLLPHPTGATRTSRKRKCPDDEPQFLPPKIARIGAFPFALSRAVRESVYSKLCCVARQHEHQLERACRFRSKAESWCMTQLPGHAQAASQFLGDTATKTAHSALAHIDSSAFAMLARWPGQARNTMAPTITQVPEQIVLDQESVLMRVVEAQSCVPQSSEDSILCEQEVVVATEKVVICDVVASTSIPDEEEVAEECKSDPGFAEVHPSDLPKAHDLHVFADLCDQKNEEESVAFRESQAKQVVTADAGVSASEIEEDMGAQETIDIPVHESCDARHDVQAAPLSAGPCEKDLEEDSVARRKPQEFELPPHVHSVVSGAEMGVDDDKLTAGVSQELMVQSQDNVVVDAIVTNIVQVNETEVSALEANAEVPWVVGTSLDNLESATATPSIAQEQVVDVDDLQVSEMHARALESSVHGLGESDGATATFSIEQDEGVINNRELDVTAVPGGNDDVVSQGYTPAGVVSNEPPNANSPAVGSAMLRLQMSRSLGGA